ncbi:hypothetical protein MTO96_045190 [Rhipicephalus appendiculatus]
MDPTEVLGGAWLRYFLATMMYGCTNPLSTRSIHEVTSQVTSRYSYSLATVRHGWHRLLRTACSRLNDDIVNYVRSTENAPHTTRTVAPLCVSKRVTSEGRAVPGARGRNPLDPGVSVGTPRPYEVLVPSVDIVRKNLHPCDVYQNPSAVVS